MPSPQTGDWPAQRAAAIHADSIGIDSIWVPDHIVAPDVWPAGASFDAIASLAAYAECTQNAQLGGMVHPVSMRHPALLLKAWTTIDHISQGRAYLGMGAGWYEPEHIAAGITFKRAGERIADLEDAARFIRATAGEIPRNQVQGDYREFANLPSPLARPRILIGGIGLRTLQIVARYADAWNAMGTFGEVSARLLDLQRICSQVGRPFEEIELHLHVGVALLRPTEADALATATSTARANGSTTAPKAARSAPTAGEVPCAVGSVDAVALNLHPYVTLGFTHFYFDLLAPYDMVTLRLLVADLRPRLQDQASSHNPDRVP